MIACILLTAGQSRRFGSPKALANVGAKNNIEQLQDKLISSSVGLIVIVQGQDYKQVLPFVLNHNKVISVYNKDHIFGQTSSFQTGLEHLPSDTKGVMLLPVDYAFITIKTINYLCDEFLKKLDRIIIPTHSSKKGHPPIFPIEFRDNFLALNHDQGLNTIQRQHADRHLLIDVEDSGVVDSFNTPEELQTQLKAHKLI